MAKNRTDAQSATAKAVAPRAMTHEEILRFLKDLAETWPDATSELVFNSPYQLLISTLLAAQATDASVNKVTPALFARAPGPSEMSRLTPDDVSVYIRSIGLWRNKAKNIVVLSQKLMNEYDGELPHDRAALESLPGVGRKTAAVVFNVAWNEPVMPVDTHCFRLANRTGLAPGKNTDEVADRLEARIPRDMIREAHHWLILQGRYVCKARKPECWRCTAVRDCLFPKKTPAPPLK